MAQLCFYFQLHQPYRLADFDIFQIGSRRDYFDFGKQVNQRVFQKVAGKSYIPMLSLLLRLIKTYPEFTFALSCSGVFLEQAQTYAPRVITLLQRLARSGRVEFLAETYYHSLAALYSESEFFDQIQQHQQIIRNLFGVSPQVFRNTELIYSDAIAQSVSQLDFIGMLTEAVPRYLQGGSKTRVYRSVGIQPIPLLLKHAELSDDIAFRFSDPHWPGYPLTAERYVSWLQSYGKDEHINLFMDFETFGEHQWEDTGIFDFFAECVSQAVRSPQLEFVQPTQVFTQLKSQVLQQLPVYAVSQPISWADIDRDLTAWVANDLQQDTIRTLYGLEKSVLASKNQQLLKDWRRLQTSDHFYYMCTKWSADGDVHAYFNPYHSPLEAYRKYSIVLADLSQRVNNS